MGGDERNAIHVGWRSRSARPRALTATNQHVLGDPPFACQYFGGDAGRTENFADADQGADLAAKVFVVPRK